LQERRRGQIYGRRTGHRLSPRQAGLLARLLPALRIADAAAGSLEPRGLFAPPPAEVWLEIGFGGGEHLAWQAARHPEIGMIGVEPYVNGIAKLLRAVEEGHLANVRVHDGDARELLERLAPASLARAFILFPDPWPKRRHWKRRIVQRETVAALARLIRPGGELRLASDDAAMTGWSLRTILASGAFAWAARRAADWRHRPPDSPSTRYEEKALAAGRRPAYLTFHRV